MNIQPAVNDRISSNISSAMGQESMLGEAAPKLSDFTGTGADMLASHFKLPDAMAALGSGLSNELGQMQSPEASKMLEQLGELLEKLGAGDQPATAAQTAESTETSASTAESTGCAGGNCSCSNCSGGAGGVEAMSGGAEGAEAMSGGAEGAEAMSGAEEASEAQGAEAAAGGAQGGDIQSLLQELKELLTEIMAMLQGGGAGGGAEGDVKPRTVDGSDETGSGDTGPSPEGGQQAASLDGKAKFYGADGAEAEKLKSTFDEMYQNDADFKAEVDKVIDEHGSINITAKDLDPNTLGIATVGGNTLAIDSAHIQRGGDDLKETLAHEVLHNVGHQHGSEMDHAIHEATH